MKIIKGEKYYKKREVADLVGKSPQTINLWDKWSREREEAGEERLIPKPIRLDNNYRYWHEDDIEKIKEFADNIEYGDLAKYSRRQWGDRGAE
jgi:hypothetical protein